METVPSIILPIVKTLLTMCIILTPIAGVTWFFRMREPDKNDSSFSMDIQKGMRTIGKRDFYICLLATIIMSIIYFGYYRGSLQNLVFPEHLRYSSSFVLYSPRHDGLTCRIEPENTGRSNSGNPDLAVINNFHSAQPSLE